MLVWSLASGDRPNMFRLGSHRMFFTDDSSDALTPHASSVQDTTWVKRHRRSVHGASGCKFLACPCRYSLRLVSLPQHQLGNRQGFTATACTWVTMRTTMRQQQQLIAHSRPARCSYAEL
jgi:hypothetical protein